MSKAHSIGISLKNDIFFKKLFLLKKIKIFENQNIRNFFFKNNLIKNILFLYDIFIE